MLKNKPKDRLNYHDYVQQLRSYMHSPEWKDKHKGWLNQSGHRCAMLPWVTVGKKVSGQYRPYRIHHLHYNSVGREKFWWDVLPLCPFAHDWIIHGVLSGFRSAGQQRQRYPNAGQRIVHLWCRLPGLLKGLVVLSVLVGAIALLSALSV